MLCLQACKQSTTATFLAEVNVAEVNVTENFPAAALGLQVRYQSSAAATSFGVCISHSKSGTN
jgi:hypothetical protein